MTDLAGTTKIAGHRKTQRSANRGGTKGCAKRVEGRLTALCEPAQAVFPSQAAHLIASPREYFMWIRLMANVPNQSVPRRIKNRMHRDG